MSKDELMELMKSSIDDEIKRLRGLREEEHNMLSKARVVIHSCEMLVGGDLIKDKEKEKIRQIYSRYCIPYEVVEIYHPEEVGMMDLESMEAEIQKHKIGLGFLGDLYGQLCELSMIYGLPGPGECTNELLDKIARIFGIKIEEEEEPEDGVEDDSCYDEGNDPELAVEKEETD